MKFLELRGPPLRFRGKPLLQLGPTLLQGKLMAVPQPRLDGFAFHPERDEPRVPILVERKTTARFRLPPRADPVNQRRDVRDLARRRAHRGSAGKRATTHARQESFATVFLERTRRIIFFIRRFSTRQVAARAT